MKNIKVYILAIILLFLITRLYQIDTNPPGVYWDEASIGYNAYSILKTGKDEWGSFLPIHIRAFGEFKLPVYIYTTAIFENIFGLNELAVRLPAVLFSLGTLLFTFLLATRISSHKVIGLFSAFLLSIMPWFFIFSRTGYEVTAGLMFFILGLYLFLLGTQKYYYIFLANFSLILSIYSYNSFRIIVPITLIFLLCYLFKKWLDKPKLFIFTVVINLLIFVIFSIPIVRLVVLDSGASRLQAVGVFSSSSERILPSLAKNYISHFSPNFLFISGDINFRSNQPGFGELGWIFLPFILMGLIFIYKSRNVLLYLIPLMIVLAPIPASITKESPHALRSIVMAPFLAILSACGIYYAGQLFKKDTAVYSIISALFLGFFLNYFYSFTNIYPNQSSKDWQYGYKKVFTSYSGQLTAYDHVLVSDYQAQPYIFSLFYNQVSPDEFVGKAKYNSVDKWGFSTVLEYKNLQFRPIDFANLPTGSLLIFASPQEKLKGIIESDVIRNLDGSVAFYVYKYHKK